MAQQVSGLWRQRYGARQVVGRIELINETGTIVKSTDINSESAPLHVTDCTVTWDRSRTVWGSASARIEMAPDSAQEILALLPTSPGAPLSPVGGVGFRVSAGFYYPTIDTTELVYCGRYDIDTCEVTETAAGIAVDLEGIDILGRVDVADMPIGFDIPWGRTAISAAQDMITAVIPWIGFDADPSDYIAGRWANSEGSNRLTNVRFIMAVIGMEAFSSADGSRIVMRRLPSTLDPPAWVYQFDEWGEVHSLSSGMDRKRVYNWVVAKGENPNTNEAPVRADAYVTDLSDPTHYIPGPPVQTLVGPRPYWLTSPWILTQAQAQDAADSELRRIRGLLQRVGLQIAPNPAINPGDVIAVQRPEIGIVGSYMVQSVSFKPGFPDPMTITCEERRV